MHPRLRRLAETARLAGQVVGVAATIALLASLWVALHAAEEDGLAALLAEAGDGDD